MLSRSGGQNSSVALAYVLLAAASLFWAGNSTVARALHADVSPVSLSFWRWFVAVAVLAPFVWSEVRREWPAVRRSLRTIMLCALFGTGWQSVLTFWSLHHTLALHVQLFNSTIPLTVMLAVWLLDGVRPGRRELGGFAVSMVGVVFIIGHGDPLRVATLDLNVGDLAALASMLIWGLYAALVKHCPRELSAYGLTFVTGLCGVVFVAPAHLWEVARDPAVLQFSAPVLGAILYTGLMSSLLATVFFNVGIARVGPSRASIFIHFVPVFGAFLSVGLLGEALTWYHAIGFVFVLAGVVICNRAKARR